MTDFTNPTEPMDHNIAVQSGASERYTLRAMSQEEATAFELHYFDCPACAKDLEAAYAFRATAKEILAENRADKAAPVIADKVAQMPAVGARKRAMPSWLSPLLAASLTAVGFLAWQQLGPGGSGASEEFAVLHSTTLKAVARGEERPNRVLFTQSAPRQVLQFDAVWENAKAGQPIRLQLTNSAGTVIGDLSSATPELGSPLEVALSKTLVTPGDYRIQVLSSSGEKLMHCDFAVVYE